MAKPRTHANAPRTKKVCIRLTPDEYLRRSVDARKAGLSLSGLCERMVTQGKVEVASNSHAPMDPALFAEFRRIGNNANQIAHALNSNLPPDVQFAWQTARDLLQLLAREELSMQRAADEVSPPAKTRDTKAFIAELAQALSQRTPANDPPSAQARHVFQRSVHVHSARRRQEDE